MSEVERAFDELWKPSPGSTQGTGSLATTGERFVPAVDVHEDKEFYLLSMDLPGLAEKDVRIEVQNGRLTVSGERNRETRREDDRFRRYERSFGRFERTFALPQNVDQEKIKARFENGVLEMMVPKSEVSRTRTVAIERDKGGLFSRLLGDRKAEAKDDTDEKH